MITVALFNIIVVVFAYLAYRYRSDLFLKISFFLIFLFLALRYDYGNDYHVYLDRFIAINQGADFPEFELGWIYLCKIFGPFGFFSMVAFIAAVQTFVYYWFIKNNVEPKYYWLTLFLYLFTPASFLILTSAMRQSVALIIFIVAVDYIYKRDFLRYFICIGIASMFHSSALVLFPFYLLCYVSWRINGFVAIILFILYPLMYLMLNYLEAQVNQLVATFFYGYDKYLDKDMSKIGSGIGFVFGLLVFALIIAKLRVQSGLSSLITKIAILSYYFMPFAFINSMVGRIGMYFQPFLIIAYVSVFSLIKNRSVRSVVIAVYACIALLSYYNLFQSDIWREDFGVYKTIFSAP